MSAHFYFGAKDFEEIDSIHKASSVQTKNYTSNEPLRTTASMSDTARSMSVATQSDILQGIGHYQPVEYITQTLHDELSRELQGIVTGDSPFYATDLTRPGANPSRRLGNEIAVNRAVTMEFSPIHSSELDDYENLTPPGMEGYSNGNLPPEALTSVAGAPGHRLWHGAAAAWAAMREDMLRSGFVNDDNNRMITSTYRTYDQQFLLKYDQNKNRVIDGLEGPDNPTGWHNSYAATPGTSKHGWGIAIDFNSAFYAEQTNRNGVIGFDWLIQYAHRYGFVWPDWAQKPGSNFRNYYEPWHWEYRGHVNIDSQGSVSANYR